MVPRLDEQTDSREDSRIADNYKRHDGRYDAGELSDAENTDAGAGQQETNDASA